MGGCDLGDSQPVRSSDRVGNQVAIRQITEETHLGFGSEACPEETGHFGYHEHRDDQGPRMALKELKAPCVVLVIGVDVGVEGAGVDQQSYCFTSARRISSIRSEMSECPLCPEPAATKRRLLLRPPR